MTVTTMILHDGTLALVEPKPANPRTDHRVFRANPYGGYEWAHFADVDANSSRARWYGWGSPELPATMTANAYCKPGSAWHDWQCEAAQWVADNPNATAEEINRAADKFGSDFVGLGNPRAAYGARRRAFIEGATNA